VRDDIDYYLQVQAPYSADWITAVGRDETIGFKLQGTFIGSFTGFNGKYIRLNDLEDSHGGHAGYRLRSIGDTFDTNAQWFVAIKTALQPHIQFSGANFDLVTLQKELNDCNITMDSNTLNQLLLQINGQ
jgi:hypothetical protein